jgi:UDP-N-acetyl-2-amino-2-deoxyglucuronate dehydrogenase
MNKQHEEHRQITVGIIGVGRIGKKHAEVFASLGSDVKLLGVADIDRNKVIQVAGALNTRSFTDFQDLLALKPDLAVICTPHHMHREPGEAAAKAGCHVLMEKPLADTMESARAIVETCKQTGSKLAVGFVHRYRQELQMAYKTITSGDVGIPGMINDIFGNPGGQHIPDWVWQKRYSGGGIITYSGIHSIDWQCWLMNSDVDEVYARSLSRYPGSDVEDAFIGTIIFENGAIGSLIGNQPPYQVSPITRLTEIYGSKACLRMRMREYLIFSNEDHSYQVNISRDDPFIPQALDMIRAIREDRQPWISGEDGLRAQAIMTAFYQSAEVGRLVRVKSVL